MVVNDLDLLPSARDWVLSAHPHPRHIERTLDWLLVIAPDAGGPLQLAALLHDIERAVPAADGKQPDPFADGYNDWHQERSMQVAARWLFDQGASADLLAEVSALIRVHEDGGWPEANLLQAADSLSFLETQGDLFAGLVKTGRITPADAVGKVQWMYDRIQVPRARTLAGPLLEESLTRLSQTRTA